LPLFFLGEFVGIEMFNAQELDVLSCGVYMGVIK